MKSDYVGVGRDSYIFRDLMKLSYDDMNNLIEHFVRVIGEDGVDKANLLSYEAMTAVAEYLISKSDEYKISNGEIACMWIIMSISAGLSFLGECEQAAIRAEIDKLDIDFLEEEEIDE